MTCAHVLDLIDAGPFAVHPRGHLDAAREHAVHCPTCGPALTMMRALETDLATLGEPAPAPDFTAVVLARIAHTAAVAEESHQNEASTSGWQRWPAWAGALGGAAALVAIQSTASTDTAVFAPRTGTVTTSLLELPPASSSMMLLAIGLFLYARGLFSVTATVSPARRGAAGGTGSTLR